MTGRIIEVNQDLGGGVILLPNRARQKLRFRLEPGMALAVGDTVSFDAVRDPAGQEYAVHVVRQERNFAKFNTEDKNSWMREGASLEEAFVEEIVPYLDRDIRINPRKKVDPRVIDLVDYTNKRYADLKTQETPFFLVAKKYPQFGYDPQYAVTFNHKDYLNYRERCPDCDIYYSVRWNQTEGYGVRLEPMSGVWVAAFRDMRALIESGQVALHPYQFRRSDQINAKDSYVFDLRNPIFTRLL